MTVKHTISVLALSLLTYSSFAQQRCHSDEYHQDQLAKHPELAQAKTEHKAFIQNKIAEKQFSKQGPGETITIPVVFHVVYKTNSQNIPDARIHEQIDILNADFSGNNDDIINVPADFEPFIGDTRIQFALAEFDSTGAPTTGITRESTFETSFSLFDDGIKFEHSGGAHAWNTQQYLNIWVGNIESGILGYATPPATAGAQSDGVVISYRYVGNSASGTPFNLGRTATHEVGHYFGLEHLWGPHFGGCSEDDGIDDTPLQAGENYGDPAHPISSCGSADMFMNYMDYCNDASLIMFTEEQELVMETVLETTRSTLITSPGIGINETEAGKLFSIYPNPAKNEINIKISENQEDAILSITDISGKLHLSTHLNSGNQTIDVSTFAEGLYLFELKTATETRTQKIIIAN